VERGGKTNGGYSFGVFRSMFRKRDERLKMGWGEGVVLGPARSHKQYFSKSKGEVGKRETGNYRTGIA